ncbi:IS110 family transposase [Marinobacterium nitratireducens]|uniref:IS110 family transposase n=1 Tax=Marinobacterium nitratireducens TaxID=518897 RepID=A0A917Z670_9GAMM|nr:IS110 family transposase [Marinobacterium nitratireducens]GGO76388.1 IS110 family transposase [Marinobacterium nitratireducens]
MNATRIGIDLAKNSFQLHGVGSNGKVALRKKLTRTKLLPFIANLPACEIGMEACGSAHYWAREFAKFGHSVKLIAPQFVKPYVKSNKNDSADAEAICEAMSRPNMRFVPIKTQEQQASLSMHRVREGLVQERTAVANRIRGLLFEFGLVIPAGIRHLRFGLQDVIEANEHALPNTFRLLVQRLLDHFAYLDQQLKELEQDIHREYRASEACRRLGAIPGIGPITATALVATIGDARSFQSGRQLAAWLGLVPRQHSTGGKPTLLGISKRGDGYLRRNLIHGARAVMRFATDKDEPVPWLVHLLQRRHKNVVITALANKNVRVAWALLTHECDYQIGYRGSAA